MIYRVVTQKLVDTLFSTIDNKEYYDVILYGLEIAISTLVNMILVITVACILKIPMETLLFCVFFMPLRIFSGGAHAKSHSICIGVFLLCQVGSIYISKQVSNTTIQYVLIFVLLVVSCVLCISYAAKNKKTSMEVRVKHRKTSLVIVFIELMLIAIGTILGKAILQYALIAVLAMFCQSMALLPIWSVKQLARSKSKGEIEYEENASETYH